jgi:hypothetical protein
MKAAIDNQIRDKGIFSLCRCVEYLEIKQCCDFIGNPAVMPVHFLVSM